MNERQYLCGKCGTVVTEKAFILDEEGNRVLNCPECNARIAYKRFVKATRLLPSHLNQMPEAHFNKRPV